MMTVTVDTIGGVHRTGEAREIHVNDTGNPHVILPGHSPMISVLTDGKIDVAWSDKTISYPVANGFIETTPTHVHIVVLTEW